MTAPTRTSGFVLIGVLFMLVAIAAVVLALVDDTHIDYSAVGSRTDYQSLRYTVEAGVQNAQWSLTNNETCANYAGNSGTPIGTSAYRTEIAPASGSPVSIGVTARDGQGNVMSADFAETIVYGARQTLEVRMTPDDPNARIEGKDDKQDHNHSDENEQETDSKSGEEVRMLLQFSLPDLPQTVQILTATITLEVTNFDEPSNVFVHQLTGNWDEENVNWIDSVGGFFGKWDNGGGDYITDSGGVLRLAAEGPTTADITSIVHNWYAGSDNHGLIFIVDPLPADVNHKYATGDVGEQSERPLLTIEYACECGSTCDNTSAAALPMLLSFDDDVDADAQTFARGDAFEFDPAMPTAQALFVSNDDLVPTDANLTALFRDTDGSYVMSTRDDVTAGGTNFSEGDVFRLDPSDDSSSLLLAASRLGGGTRVDAVHILDSNTVVFSINADRRIDGTDYYPDDLIAYNLSNDSMSRYLDGFLMFPSGVGNIDAAHVFPSGIVALSFDSAETVAGVSVDPDDLLLFDQTTETGSLYYDNTLIVQNGAGQENLDALFLNIDGSPAIGDTVSDGGVGCTGQYRDNFSGADYSTNMGSLSFTTDWLEVGESDGSDSGDVRLIDDSGEPVLRIRDNDNGGEGVQREFDLTSATSAALTFSTRRDRLDEASDYVSLSVSNNGGSNWTELDRFAGPNNDSAYQSHSYDLSPYISSNTRIRFVSSSTNGGTDTVYFDNVAISLSGCP